MEGNAARRLFRQIQSLPDLIQGDWFDPGAAASHRGVYLNGEWLIEAAKLSDVLQPAVSSPPGRFGLARRIEDTTSIWAQLRRSQPATR